MMKNQLTEYYEILNDFEDYLKTGKKQNHKHIEINLKQKNIIQDSNIDEVDVENDSIEKIISEVSECRKCSLCKTRNNVVPGEGVNNPLVLVVGEGPGADEDKTGKPFVGKAGQFLDKWLEAIELSRNTNCFIGNIIKCRPPGNRDPLPEESESCIPYLERQIKLLQPKVILCVGRIPSQILLDTTEGITRLRGRSFEYKGIPVIPTFHPSAVLRNMNLKRPVWEDLKKLKSFINNDPLL